MITSIIKNIIEERNSFSYNIKMFILVQSKRLRSLNSRTGNLLGNIDIEGCP